METLYQKWCLQNVWSGKSQCYDGDIKNVSLAEWLISFIVEMCLQCPGESQIYKKGNQLLDSAGRYIAFLTAGEEATKSEHYLCHQHLEDTMTPWLVSLISALQQISKRRTLKTPQDISLASVCEIMRCNIRVHINNALSHIKRLMLYIQIFGSQPSLMNGL